MENIQQILSSDLTWIILLPLIGSLIVYVSPTKAKSLACPGILGCSLRIITDSLFPYSGCWQGVWRSTKLARF